MDTDEPKRKMAEWQAYIAAHQQEQWIFGKVYDSTRGWCVMWKVGDKALTLNVGGARVMAKDMRRVTTEAANKLDEAAREAIDLPTILALFDHLDEQIAQCMTLNEQGAVPRSLGGTYDEPLAEVIPHARPMQSLTPDGREGDFEGLQAAMLAGVAALDPKEQIQCVASTVSDFADVALDAGVRMDSIAAGTHIALMCIVVAMLPKASDDELRAFMVTATDSALGVARTFQAAQAAGVTEERDTMQ